MENIKELKPGSIVIYNGSRYKIISVNFGGKCKLKKLISPNKGMLQNNIDITEIRLPNNYTKQQ